MKTACRYAILRFTPYIETGEFANAGIVMLNTSTGKLTYRLENRRYGRITRFFDDLNKNTYLAAIKNIDFELTRVRALSESTDTLNSLFDEIIRPRETIIKFSNARTVMCTDPQRKLDELFGFYVERNFVTKEYKEVAMEKAIRGLLKGANLDRKYKKCTLGDGFYEATFPFVSENDRHKPRIIKPLHLDHEKPSEIMDLAGKWLFRVHELRERNILGDDILFTVDTPAQNTNAYDAYRVVVERFKRDDIKVLKNDNKDKILRFAAKLSSSKLTPSENDIIHA